MTAQSQLASSCWLSRLDAELDHLPLMNEGNPKT